MYKDQKNKSITREKAVHALKLLFIGEVFIVFGILGELNVIYQPLAFIALFAIVGVIIIFVGIFKLIKLNRYFLISALSIIVALVIGLVGAIIPFTNPTPEFQKIFAFFETISSKFLSMLLVFGIIRGCAKAATGTIEGLFAKIMINVNFYGKLTALVFSILEIVFRDINLPLSKTFAVISMVLYISVEVFFACFTYLAYKKAKNTLHK